MWVKRIGHDHDAGSRLQNVSGRKVQCCNVIGYSEREAQW
jgi:hypothetical protein